MEIQYYINFCAFYESHNQMIACLKTYKRDVWKMNVPLLYVTILINCHLVPIVINLLKEMCGL